MFDLRRLSTDLIALGLLAALVFVGLSLFSFDALDPPATAVWPARSETLNLCGPQGALFAHLVFRTLGVGAYALFAALVAFDLRLFARRPLADPWLRLGGIGLVVITLCTALAQFAPTLAGGTLYGSGGYLGVLAADVLEKNLQWQGRWILLGSTLMAGSVLIHERVMPHWLGRVFVLPFLILVWPFRRWRARRTERRLANHVQPLAAPAVAPTPTPVQAPVPVAASVKSPPPAPIEDEEEIDPPLEKLEKPVRQPVPAVKAPLPAAPRPPIKVNPPIGAVRKPAAAAPCPPQHELPDVELLEVAEEFPYDLLAEKARVAAVTLERTFQEFGLNVRVKEIDTGPVITQFELDLEAGLRVSKVSALADDLAIALRVPSVRIVSPIPGKNTVGVEVPNEKQVMVRLRELIESCPQEVASKRIPIFLGKDVSGRPLVVDLAKMPHLLIAGRTGTGKSVCLNTLILSMLLTRTPDQVKMLMIDPKMVELSPYKRVPHLMNPVITDMKKAEAVLAWAVDKMEERYDLLARCGVRHLDSYNKLGKAEVLKRTGIDPDGEEAERIPETMPYIVIIADEMADMMMTSGKDVEGHIIRLAQKSRAVGIHLVLATQKPTVDVITGLIKSNLPARIAFQVASRVDSRVVLDEMGAERLLGNGDMLYLAPGTSNLTRAQGTFVSDDEVNKVIDFYGQYPPEYSHELAQLSTAGRGGKGGIEALRARDDMYEQAIEIVIQEGRGSTSLLQRALGIGYGRAARLVDYMAEDGIVGDYNGSQAREVLYTMEQWDALKAGAELEPAGA